MQIPRCKINEIYYGSKKKEKRFLIYVFFHGKRDRKIDSYIE